MGFGIQGQGVGIGAERAVITYHQQAIVAWFVARGSNLFRARPKVPMIGFDASKESYGVPDSFPWRWSITEAVANLIGIINVAVGKILLETTVSVDS